MAKMSNFKTMKFVVALFAVIFIAVGSALAQNLIDNPDFEQTNYAYQNYSDYERIYGGGVLEGRFIHDVTSSAHGVGNVGWPANLTGYGGSGYYLLFNGFGGNLNPSKAVWRQTVPVTSNTVYTFSAQVRNLSQYYMGIISPNPAVMRLKINGIQVGADNTLPQSNFDWHEWTVTWNSGNATQAIIEIVDAYTGEHGRGDDFAIDHLSFTPNTVYSVTASNDSWSLACMGTAVEIPVLANDVISPGIQNATETTTNELSQDVEPAAENAEPTEPAVSQTEEDEIPQYEDIWGYWDSTLIDTGEKREWCFDRDGYGQVYYPDTMIGYSFTYKVYESESGPYIKLSISKPDPAPNEELTASIGWYDDHTFILDWVNDNSHERFTFNSSESMAE